MSDEIVETSFQIIACSGTAKSLYIEAIQTAKSKDFEKVESLFNEADEVFVSAHKVHASLVQKEAQGIATEVSLLLVHAEDQMASCETIKLLAQEIIALYKLIEK